MEYSKDYTSDKTIWWIGEINGIIHFGTLNPEQLLTSSCNITFYETQEEYDFHISQLLNLGLIEVSNINIII